MNWMNTCSLFACGLVRIVVSMRTSVANNDKCLDKKTDDQTFYIDIKSDPLQEILREVLQGVKGICLDGEEPMVCLYQSRAALNPRTGY
jgi:hypothetical protein